MDHAAGRFCDESIGENEVMERLTEKHYLGTDHYMKCSGNCNVDMDCIDCPSFDRLVERLAAYDDTGLAPEQLTTADVVPVVHGRWEMRLTGMATDTGPEYKAYCTVCNKPNKQYQPPYYPHCVAKMDMGRGGENASKEM